MNPTDRPQNPTELGLAGGSPPEADRRAADREPAMGAWPVRESRGVHARCLRGCRRTDPGPRNAMCGHSDLVRSKNRASGARTRRRHPNGKELKHGKCLDDTTHARAIANLDPSLANFHAGSYRTFGQASRVNFHMEPYGNRRYVIDSACRAGGVAVEKSRTRLRVMEKLSVRFCPPPQASSY